MGSLGSTGYVTTTLSDKILVLQNLFKQAFGNDINLSDQSPQGVLINKIAELFDAADKVGLDIYNEINLNNATGVILSFIAILRGTQRIEGTKAVLDVTFTSSTQPYTIAANTQFRLVNSETIFINETEITINNTTFTAQLVAVSNAETGIQAGDKLESVIYIGALTDINVDSITDGTDAETDTELRDRLKSFTSVESSGDTDAIYSALVNLDNVTKCQVWENDTNSTDGNGIPAHSIEAVVLGDTDANVAQVIYNNKSGGTPTYGSSSSIITDSQGYAKTMYFTRPTLVSLYIDVTVTTKDGQVAVDGSYNDQIRTECDEYINSLKIGQDISYSTIFGIFAKYDAFDITQVVLSDGVTDYTNSNMPIAIRSYSKINDPATDITITVV